MGWDKSLSNAPGMSNMQILSVTVMVRIETVSAANISFREGQNFMPIRIIGMTENVYPDTNDSKAARITVLSRPMPV